MSNFNPWRLSAPIIILASSFFWHSGFAQQKANPPKHDTRPGRSDRQERERWFKQQREYPLGKIPERARLRAWQQTQQSEAQTLAKSLQSAAPAAAVQGNVWVNIGPAPIQGGQIAPPQPVSGRITAIAVDPLDSTHWVV